MDVPRLRLGQRIRARGRQRGRWRSLRQRSQWKNGPTLGAEVAYPSELIAKRFLNGKWEFFQSRDSVPGRFTEKNCYLWWLLGGPLLLPWCLVGLWRPGWRSWNPGWWYRRELRNRNYSLAVSSLQRAGSRCEPSGDCLNRCPCRPATPRNACSASTLCTGAGRSMWPLQHI